MCVKNPNLLKNGFSHSHSEVCGGKNPNLLKIGKFKIDSEVCGGDPA